MKPKAKPKRKPRRVVLNPPIGRDPFDFVSVWLAAGTGLLDLGAAYAYMNRKNWERAK